MKIHQLSVLLENKPGHLSSPCSILADNGINVLTLALADTENHGILRIIVKDWEKAGRILKESGYDVKDTEVVAVQVEDRPGGLRKLLEIVEKTGVNIEYIYPFTVRCGGKAIMVFRLDNADSGIAALLQAGANVLSCEELYGLADDQ